MNEKMKPCPFCGSEASIIEVTERSDVLVEEAFIQCEGCGFSAHHKWISTETLIKYWNKRAERTCKNLSSGVLFLCSECDGQVTKWNVPPRYCPNCGAKVAE